MIGEGLWIDEDWHDAALVKLKEALSGVNQRLRRRWRGGLPTLVPAA